MKWVVALFFATGCVWGYAEDEENYLSELLRPHQEGDFWKGQPYLGDVRIEIASNEDTVSVEIDTEELHLRPVHWEDYSEYVALFSDPEGIQKYRDNIPDSEEETTLQLKCWIERWEEGADPYSAFSVFKKGVSPDDNVFVGYILLGHGFEKGQAELEFAIKREFWNLGYAKQAITAVLQHAATFFHELNYYVNLNNHAIPAAPLKSIHATSWAANTWANRALESAGMTQIDDEISKGKYLNHYFVSIEELDWLEGQKYAEVYEEGGDEEF